MRVALSHDISHDRHEPFAGEDDDEREEALAKSLEVQVPAVTSPELSVEVDRIKRYLETKQKNNVGDFERRLL